MSLTNLELIWREADATDLSEGRRAYRMYHDTLQDFAEHFEQPFDRVVAAFVSLSPNADYIGNMRSLVSLLQGVRNDAPVETITVSTYKHCRDRAHGYLIGAATFVSKTRGLKVLSFYRNILNPEDPEPVTVDGHMVCCWENKNVPMKQALVKSRSHYREIADGIRHFGAIRGLLGNQVQATLWFTRKRVFRVKYTPQLDIFCDPADIWKIRMDPRTTRPYGT
jgi:hypothetical protein